ncbi:MAG: gliding motility protein GldL [Paludibacter sp.]|nr:gliding motility protein GldL [Paludibacter sp.]
MVERLKRLGSVKIPVRERIFNAGYGLGASVVILGALFKLLYWDYANEMLMIGMFTEAIIFAVSAFEKPFKTYEWDRIFDFETGKVDLKLNGSDNLNGASNFTPAAQTSYSPVNGQYNPDASPTASALRQIEGLSDADVDRLSKSIQQLAKTAEQLQTIASFSLETEKFAHSIQHISQNTSKYAESQESLVLATNKLQEIYERIGEDTEKIEVNTQEYRNKVERINSNLSGMNSIYEIQLKDIHAQSVHFHNQTQISKKMTEEMQLVTGEIGKLKYVSDDFSLATEKLKHNANELADNIAKLNQIYGNMLNAMN